MIEHQNEKWFERALRALPGGVNSPVRAFRQVGGSPRVIASASGCHLHDVEGRRYIDYIGSWGAMIAGHAHPEVVAAASEALKRGSSFGTASTLEVELAEEVLRRVPGLQRIRFVNSGTEAVMSAIRLARAAVGRSKIVKFEGCYHGHTDSMLVRAGSGVATLGLPDSPGVTNGATQDTLCAIYNDIQSVDAAFAEHGSEIAAVIVEPIAGNMGVVAPKRDFLKTLREITSRHGALLIFDEVMTGFRVAQGGAQQLFDINADLVIFGKIIGGGFPVGAYGGRADLMDLIAPSGTVYQAGTLSGNPVSMAAGLATLKLLTSEAYLDLERSAARLEVGLKNRLTNAAIPGVVQRVGSMLTLFFATNPIDNLANAKAANHRRFASFFRSMLEHGVHLPPSGYEAWFVSMAHNEASIDQTLVAVGAALAAC